MLRQVWVQQYYQDHGAVRWRDHKNVPPSALMIASPYDLEVPIQRKTGPTLAGL